MLGPNVRIEKEDFTQGTWMSLLDLLHPSEFFVPIDQTSLWRRHVAWAKPKGKEIRDYVTQRFSSNMVFLSLLLGTDMSVLMNSSKITTEIREALMLEQYRSLKFYIGAVLALASCVTVVGLVATYTAWSMISALSDTNSNTMLRSSMGQYVTAMPSKFVVASLYLFLLWLTLILIEIISGPLILVLLSAIMYMFFQVVVSLSAFGRLIIHTGAMGQKRILDPEFERQLLPSGLHASLLIKATERSRRKTSVTDQYRPNIVRNPLERGASVDSVRSAPADCKSFRATPLPNRGQPSVIGQDVHAFFPQSTHLFDGHESLTNQSESHGDDTLPLEPIPGGPTPSSAASHPPYLKLQPYTHGSRCRTDSAESGASVDDLVNQIDFPRASFLNRTENKQLKNVVNQTLSARDGIAELVQEAGKAIEEEEEKERRMLGMQPSSTQRWPERAMGGENVRDLARRRSLMVSQASTRLQEEWNEEEDVRQVYDIEPPIDFLADGHCDDDERLAGSAEFTLHRVSLLNRTKNLGSLRNLLSKGISFTRMPSARDLGPISEKNAVAENDDSETGTRESRETKKKERLPSADDLEVFNGERTHLLA